jgi:hypothetical protein
LSSSSHSISIYSTHQIDSYYSDTRENNEKFVVSNEIATHIFGYLDLYSVGSWASNYKECIIKQGLSSSSWSSDRNVPLSSLFWRPHCSPCHAVTHCFDLFVDIGKLN